MRERRHNRHYAFLSAICCGVFIFLLYSSGNSPAILGKKNLEEKIMKIVFRVVVLTSMLALGTFANAAAPGPGPIPPRVQVAK
jgi:hypothetical protein